MEYKDYYKLLGVERNATAEEIKRAYRKLARKHHPDVNPGDKAAEQRFKEINEAQEVLTDVEKRKKYDQLGSQWQQWQQNGQPATDFDWSQWAAGGQPGGQRAEYRDMNDMFGQGGDFSDFFESLFGGAGRRAGGGGRGRARAAQRGQDYEQPVEITLEEAFSGAARLLQLGERRLEVKIPAGVKTGSRVRMSGEGAPGQAGSGDLFLKISVLPHPLFERKENDLYVEVDVDLYTAILGGEIKVATLTGALALRIPPETQSGRSIRLNGQGMPVLGKPAQRGDLYVKVRVKLPTGLSDEEKALFRDLAGRRA
jgi:curved DNA-binding protein